MTEGKASRSEILDEYRWETSLSHMSRGAAADARPRHHVHNNEWLTPSCPGLMPTGAMPQLVTRARSSQEFSA